MDFKAVKRQLREAHSELDEINLSFIASMCCALFESKDHELFHLLDCLNFQLLQCDIPIPHFIRERVKEVTLVRIENTKANTVASIPKKEINRRTKNSLLRYMLKLVIAGATVERASEIAVMAEINEQDGRFLFKASSLEKDYPKFANSCERSNHSRKDEMTRILENLTNYYIELGLGIYHPNREKDLRFWKDIIEKSKNRSIPFDLKGSRRW